MPPLPLTRGDALPLLLSPGEGQLPVDRGQHRLTREVCTADGPHWRLAQRLDRADLGILLQRVAHTLPRSAHLTRGRVSAHGVRQIRPPQPTWPDRTDKTDKTSRTSARGRPDRTDKTDKTPAQGGFVRGARPAPIGSVLSATPARDFRGRPACHVWIVRGFQPGERPNIRSGGGIWSRGAYARTVELDTPKNTATSSVIHQSAGSSCVPLSLMRHFSRQLRGEISRATSATRCAVFVFNAALDESIQLEPAAHRGRGIQPPGSGIRACQHLGHRSLRATP